MIIVPYIKPLKPVKVTDDYDMYPLGERLRDLLFMGVLKHSDLTKEDEAAIEKDTDLDYLDYVDVELEQAKAEQDAA